MVNVFKIHESLIVFLPSESYDVATAYANWLNKDQIEEIKGEEYSSGRILRNHTKGTTELTLKPKRENNP